MSPLARLDRALAGRPDLALESPEPAALRAVREVRFGVRCEALDPRAVADAQSFLTPRSADDLRLPPPPVQATDGFALFMALSRVAERFQGAELRGADAAALEKLAKLQSVCCSLQAIEVEIRDRANMARPG